MLRNPSTVLGNPSTLLRRLEAQNRRLQALVAELILENQTLRFDMTQLETRLRKNEQALKAATAWAGMLF